jgi:PAS domain S-box-containing protein
MTFLKSVASRVIKASLKVPLRTLLVLPFIVQIVLVVGLTGWLSLYNGEKAVNDFTSQLRQEVSSRIEQKLKDYLQVPNAINQINAHTISFDEWNLPNIGSLTRKYWNQRYMLESVKLSSIFFGSTQGEYIGIAAKEDSVWNVSKAGKSTEGKYQKYATDRLGNPTKLIGIGQDYDPRRRPWYKEAVSAGKSNWSEIYPDFVDTRLTITLAQPVYNDAYVLRGVVGVDLVLAQIGDFLETLKIGKTGKTFIIERSGLLVATSTSQKPYIRKDGKFQRLKATDFDNDLIRATAEHLKTRFGDFKQIKNNEQLDFSINGKHELLQVVPFSDDRNLDWVIVVVVPEEDFMGRIYDNTRTTILLCLAALGIAVLIGLFTSHWIALPIRKLSNAATALERGEWNQKVPDIGVYEMRVLAKSFNRMALELQLYFAALETAKTELENRVEERTNELLQTNQQLQVEIQERQRSEQLLRSIVEGTSSVTGDDFFRSLVHHLAAALQVRYSLITEYLNPVGNRARTLAFWMGTNFGSNIEYSIKNTPCERIIQNRGSQCFPQNLQSFFPENPDLIRFGVESYLGTPLIDSLGNILGHLAVMDDKPMEDIDRKKSILEIFASRAAAERERKLSEEALSKSEKLNRSLLRAIPDLMIRINTDGIFLDFLPSKHVESIFSPEEIIGKSVYEVLPPEVAQQRLYYVQQALRTERTQFHEYQIVINGEVCYEESRIVACGEDEALIIVRNITDRKQAEQALRESEANYRELAVREELINRIANQIRNSLDLEIILETAVHEIHDLLEIDRCQLMWFRPDEEQPYWEIVKEAKKTDLPSSIGCYPVSDHACLPDAYLEQFLRREVFRLDNVETPEEPIVKQFFLSLGYTSMVGLPIQTHSGKMGVINCGHCGETRSWSDSEVELLQAVTDQLAIAISQAELYEQSRKAQEQSERLLLNILPKPIAERLKNDEYTIADSFEEATVLFADIVGFTQLSSRISPKALVEKLNEIFSTFDRLAQQHGLEKIKTIGDAYMVVGGLPTPNENHADAIAEMALDMQKEIQRFQRDDEQELHIRIGINSGPVVAGVIGLNKFIYDLWGDTVNTASRMESHGIPGLIQVTATTYEKLREKFIFEERGILDVKGKGKMMTYFLKGRKYISLQDKISVL